VVGADYFGMGISTEPEGYLVKASHQQACFDFLVAAKGVMADHSAREQNVGGEVLCRVF
jgi:ribosomal protein S8